MSQPRWWRPTGAVAVAMADGPAVGLVILDALAHHPQLRRWAQLYIARAELLRCLERDGDATGAYRSALELEPAPASRSFIAGAQPAPRAYSTLAATSRAADPASTTGQILNQTTGVRAPVSAVSAPSAISSPAATR